MKKRLQLELNMSNKTKRESVQVNNWVNTALNAKTAPKESSKNAGSRILQLNMAFCKSILGRK